MPDRSRPRRARAALPARRARAQARGSRHGVPRRSPPQVAGTPSRPRARAAPRAHSSRRRSRSEPAPGVTGAAARHRPARACGPTADSRSPTAPRRARRPCASLRPQPTGPQGAREASPRGRQARRLRRPRPDRVRESPLSSPWAESDRRAQPGAHPGYTEVEPAVPTMAACRTHSSRTSPRAGSATSASRPHSTGRRPTVCFSMPPGRRTRGSGSSACGRARRRGIASAATVWVGPSPSARRRRRSGCCGRRTSYTA